MTIQNPKSKIQNINAVRILALDAGTSAGRAMLVDGRGNALAETVRPWRYQMAAEAAPWGRQFDPERFWDTICEAAQEALATAGLDDVAAIAATGQRQATVFLDGQGRELYAGPNVDLRAVFEGTRLLNEQGARIHAITGHLPPMLFASARWLWFQQHRPEVCQQTARLLMMGDWLTGRLCGQAMSDPTNAAESGLFDVTALAWSDELLAAVQVPRHILPQVVPAGTVAGRLSSPTAESLGLRAGVPVVVAGADTASGLLGMNVTQPGQIGLVAGWSAPVQMVTSEPTFDPRQALWTTCSVMDRQWVLEGNLGPAGAAHRWVGDLFLPGDDYAALDELAATAPAGAGGALAFLGPRIADYNSPQLLWGGVLFPQASDLWPVGRAELIRAALENIAFAVKANLERIEAVYSAQHSAPCGAEALTTDPLIHLGGGLSHSRLFAQIVADVLGRPVQTSAIASVSALGAAMCAATGIGEYSSLAEAAQAMSCSGELCTPDRVAQAEYLDAYERWLEAYRGLETLSAQLH